MTHILALDQGTSSSRAIVYDGSGEIVAQAQHLFEMSFPHEGWVEQDPEEIWSTVLASAREALAQLPDGADAISAIGITNQRETTLVWDRTSGACIYPAIVWQDSRTAERCREMRDDQLDGQALSSLIQSQTGLLIDPYFSSTKLAWILQNVDGAAARAQRGELCFGTVDSFLIWRLTGGRQHLTDATNASRTQLFDIHEQRWSEMLLDYFDIPADLLPEVKDCIADYGHTDPELFGRALPITGVAGDQQAALVGQGCFNAGQTKSTYGTGCFTMVNTGNSAITSSQQLLTTVGYRIDGQVSYALEGSIFVAGVGVKWLQGNQLISQASDTEADFAACQGDSGGVYFVPAFTGLGAPYWQPGATGLITGLTLDSTRAQIVTAMLQAVVFQTEELLRAMQTDGAVIEEVRVDGGMVVNDYLCQFLADILDLPVLRPRDVETTAMGAGVLAGIGIGHYEGLSEAAAAWRLDREFVPQMPDEQRAELLRGYRRAVQQVLQPVTQ